MTAGLILPPELVPAARDLPRYGWVTARAFTPAGNPVLAVLLWLPLTGQLAAAHRFGGAAAVSTGTARSAAVLMPDRGAHLPLALGILAGWAVAALPLVAAAAAFGYLAPLAIAVPVGRAAPVLLGVAFGCWLLWVVLRLPRGGPTQGPGVVRVGNLAAWPPRGGAGLRTLGRALCDLADSQQVTLDLTARTDALAALYAAGGFTLTDPTTRWMTRHPGHPSPEPARLR